jgi:hypothetical protein
MYPSLPPDLAKILGIEDRFKDGDSAVANSMSLPTAAPSHQSGQKMQVFRAHWRKAVPCREALAEIGVDIWTGSDGCFPCHVRKEVCWLVRGQERAGRKCVKLRWSEMGFEMSEAPTLMKMADRGPFEMDQYDARTWGKD